MADLQGGMAVAVSPAKDSDRDDAQSQKREALSPWDEELDVPEGQDKDSLVLGSLHSNSPIPQQKRNDSPFAVPENMEEKVGQKLSAENFIEKNDPTANEPVPTKKEGVASLIATQNKTAVTEPAATPVPNPIVETDTNKRGLDNIRPASEKNIQTLAPNEKSVDQPVPAVQPAQKPVDKTEFIAQQLADNTLKPEISQPKTLPKTKARVKLPQLPSLKSLPILIFFGLIGLFALGIFLTEYGIVSVGFEKIYGVMGIERFWGGLGKDAENAIIISSLKMKNHPDFKARGNITLTIDKSIKSDITSPLVALDARPFQMADERIMAITQSAILAQSYSNSSSYLSEPSVVSSSSSSASSSTGTSDTTTSTSSTQTTGDQSDNPSYQYQGTTVKEIPADVEAVFGKSGGKVNLEIKKVTGNYQMAILSLGQKLFLQSDSQIDYGQGDESTKWLEYRTSTLKEKRAQAEIFSLSSGAGFSLKGNRVASEKVGTIRTYKYHISQLEVGNSLSSLGITSDMVQAISGDIWLGVKDKLVYRIDLQITPSPSASVTSIDINLDLYDFDKENSLAEPDSSEIITSGGDSEPATTPDQRRKTDLTSIQNALESYRRVRGSYPVASSTIKLSTAGNILSSSLIPNYLVALPSDPKASEGWYYGYKSDGSTYTLSARFESADPAATTTASGIFLYNVYN